MRLDFERVNVTELSIKIKKDLHSSLHDEYIRNEDYENAIFAIKNTERYRDFYLKTDISRCLCGV